MAGGSGGAAHDQGTEGLVEQEQFIDAHPALVPKEAAFFASDAMPELRRVNLRFRIINLAQEILADLDVGVGFDTLGLHAVDDAENAAPHGFATRDRVTLRD